MSLVQVFLSSTTNDLISCREAAFAAICRLDGYHCVRMEDFGAKDCLPLSLCLKKVAECDVYVGILGHLYGSCPGDGEKSYTELEYEKATELGKPRLMFLASNDVPIRLDHIEDAERQQRQKRFRSRIDKDLLRQEFATPEDLALTVAAALANWGREELTALQEQSKEAQTPVGGGTHLPALVTQESITASDDAATMQRTKAVKALMTSLAAGKFGFDEAASGSPREFDVARLFLSAKALFALRCSRESLTSHEANYLYLHREALRLDSWESELLLDALLGSNADIVPGWYWFRSLTLEHATKLLWGSALESPTERVRKNAISLLQKARVDTGKSGWERENLFEAVLRDSPGVQTAFFTYLLKVGRSEDSKYTCMAIGDERLSARDLAAKAKWHIRARVEPEGAFGDLLQMPEPPSEAVSAIGGAVLQLSEDSLLRGSNCKVKSLRLVSVTELARRGKLPTEAARRLLSDDSLRIREICYKFLIGQGERFEVADIHKGLTLPDTEKAPSGLLGFLKKKRIDVAAVVRGAMENYSYDELVGLVRWLDLDGPIAYRVLAERHFDRVAAQVRDDLRGKFERLREGWARDAVNNVMAEVRKKGLPISDEEQLRERIKNSIHKGAGYSSEIEEMIYREFAAAAIAGLVEHGEPHDVALARELLANRKKSSYYGEAEAQAVRLIARFGDTGDLDALVEVAGGAHGDTKELAARTALRLSPGSEGVAKQFAGMKDSTLFRLALESLQTESSTSRRSFAEPFLSDAENFKRMEAIRFLAKASTPEELKDILSTYLMQSIYYYNVVCWLDRVLFSPAPLREAYVGELGRD